MSVFRRRFLASAHEEIARKIRTEIPDRENVVVVYQYYMYLVADLSAPNHDYTWPHAFGFEENDNSKRDAASHAVLMPASESDMRKGREWLQAGGMELFAEIPGPWEFPVQLFRWPEGRRPSL